MKKETRIALSEAKQKLGELVSRAAYGGEEFLIEVHGKPKARIVREDDHHKPRSRDEQLAALDRMTALRKRIEARTGIQPDSAELIRQAREERDEQLFGSR
ncbi:MAG TPA: type II toxin-antitoxin system Phd/YefM family antitoxin [Dehalococcoidia bacterium]|jgi:prevent-host-death family protein|nr:type II toxin-antitoxin system Phd/YefM family antitoxin [Dehalococcoidia bacterium]